MTKYQGFLTTLGQQRHVIGRAEALRNGLAESDLRRLLRLGVIERLSHQTYGLVGAPMTAERHLQAAITAARQTATRPDLVGAARSSAAWLWGLTDRAPSTSAIVVPNTSMPSPDLPAVKVHRSRTLTPDQIAIVRGIAATIPTRTITDCTMNLAVPQIMELVTRGLRLDLFSLQELSLQLRRAGRIRGAQRLRVSLRRLDPEASKAESRAEAVAKEALEATGIEVVPQYPLELATGAIRLDLALPAAGVAIEIDGYWWHSTSDQKRRDDRRQNALTAADWRVLRFCADRVVEDPAHLVADVQALLDNG